MDQTLPTEEELDVLEVEHVARREAEREAQREAAAEALDIAKE